MSVQRSLGDLCLPDPHYVPIHAPPLCEFARHLLLKASAATDPEQMQSVRQALEHAYQTVCFDLPADVLRLILEGWEADAGFVEGGLDAPADYFEQLRRKAGPAQCIEFVTNRLRTSDLEKCRSIVSEWIPHARGQVGILEEWLQVLVDRGEPEPEFNVLAEHVRARRDLSHPILYLEDYLQQERPDAEALNLAIHELRSAGSRIEISSAPLLSLLERDAKLLSPHLPDAVDRLFGGDARALALDYLAVKSIARPGAQSACALLTLCLQRHIVDSLCRSDGLPNEWLRAIGEKGLGAITRLIRGEPVSDMDGAVVQHLMGKEDIEKLESARRVRNALHHSRMRNGVQPADVRLLERLVFDDIEFLAKLAGARLRRK
jgi:hypothetical protein